MDNSLLEEEVLQLLANQELTSRDIILKTSAPSSTIYRILRNLRQEGKIRYMDRFGRSKKYTLGSGPKSTNLTPELRSTTGSVLPFYKFIGITSNPPNANAGGDAAFNIVVALARFIKLSERLQDNVDLTIAEKQLISIQAQIMESVRTLEKIADLGNQILEDTRFNNLAAINRFVEDPNFSDTPMWRGQVQEVLDYYTANMKA